jgi:ribonuclease P protein component
MLPVAHRLKKDEDFQKVASGGKYSYSPYFTLKYKPNKLEHSRFGFVISTKIDKRATVRNRLKRQIREVIRLKLAKIPHGYDITIIPKKAALELNYQQLDHELGGLFAKARL